MELVTQQNVNSQYEDLLHQYATLVNNAEVSVRSIDDKIAADSVEQLMDLLHDNEVWPRRFHCTLHLLFSLR